MIYIDEIEKLYKTATDTSKPAREIFMAEYELMKMMPKIIEGLKLSVDLANEVVKAKVSRVKA